MSKGPLKRVVQNVKKMNQKAQKGCSKCQKGESKNQKNQAPTNFFPRRRWTCIILRWRCMEDFWPKRLPHLGQACDFSFRCTHFWWRTKCIFWLKHMPHPSHEHTNILGCVWVRWCTRNALLVGKFFLQVAHSYGRTFRCFATTCLSKCSFRLNWIPQNTHACL